MNLNDEASARPLSLDNVKQPVNSILVSAVETPRPLAIHFPSGRDVQDHSPVTKMSLAITFWTEHILSTPHPLDAAWWFSDTTIRQLRDEVKAADKNVVFLGAPTLFFATLLSDRTHQITLIDSDAELHPPGGSENARFLQIDLRTGTPEFLNADLIIADPPWYEPETAAFLWAAQRVGRIGARVLVSLPPVDTRPAILRERDRLFSWAESGGLQFKELRKANLAYVSPPFERNAILSGGGELLDPEWRTGDLAIFEIVKQGGLVRPLFSSIAEWEEIILDNVRIRTRQASCAYFQDPRLLTLGQPSNIYGSVSRRDPMRSHIDVWTSGNRVYRCLGPGTLLLILVALSTGRKVIPLIENRLHLSLDLNQTEWVETAVTQIESLVTDEKNEYEAIQRANRTLAR